MTDRDHALQQAEFHGKRIREIIAQYGDGVRPSFVSADIAYHYGLKAACETEARELENADTK